MAGTAAISLLQGASVAVAADAGGLDSRHCDSDSYFLAAHSHALLNALLSFGVAAGLPLSLGAAAGIPPSGGVPIDVPDTSQTYL
jgi:hypothetical protein